MPSKIIIEVVGDPTDKGNVRLSALVDQLDNLRKALSYAEQHAAIGGKRRGMYYRVVDLHHSKATFEIELVPEDPLEDRTGATIYEFNTRLRQIEAGRVPDHVLIEELEAYGDLAPNPNRHISEFRIGFDAPTALRRAEPVQVTREFEEKVAALIGPEEVAWGTMTGFLEAINLHERNVFYLFPRVGPKRLHCTFDRSIRDAVKAAIDHYVEVAGRVHYRSRDPLSQRMSAVHSVEILDNEPVMVKLSEMRGIAPGATGQLDTVKFVDTFDEDW
jgi:hypothetical protein